LSNGPRWVDLVLCLFFIFHPDNFG
jgi:hypothetical protein